jgi:hypothetical protein
MASRIGAARSPNAETVERRASRRPSGLLGCLLFPLITLSGLSLWKLCEKQLP